MRARILRWLAAFAGAWVPDNNWVWFRAVAAAFSRSVDGTWDRPDVEHAVTRTEDWYAGGGWYTDGGRPVADHGQPRHRAARCPASRGVPAAGAHAFGRHAAVPCLRSAAPVRPGEAHAAAVALSADPVGLGNRRGLRSLSARPGG